MYVGISLSVSGSESVCVSGCVSVCVSGVCLSVCVGVSEVSSAGQQWLCGGRESGGECVAEDSVILVMTVGFRWRSALSSPAPADPCWSCAGAGTW